MVIRSFEIYHLLFLKDFTLRQKMEKAFFLFFKKGIFYQALPIGSAWILRSVLDPKRYSLSIFVCFLRGSRSYGFPTLFSGLRLLMLLELFHHQRYLTKA